MQLKDSTGLDRLVKVTKVAEPTITFTKSDKEFELDALSSKILRELGKLKEYKIPELAKIIDTNPQLIRTQINALLELGYISSHNDFIVIRSNLIKEEDNLSDDVLELLAILSRSNRLGAMEIARKLDISVVRRITRRCKKLAELGLLKVHQSVDKRVQAEYSLHGEPLCIGDMVFISLPVKNKDGVAMKFHISGSCPFISQCIPAEGCKLLPYLLNWIDLTAEGKVEK